MSIPTILVIEDNMADQILIRYALDDIGEPYHFEVLPHGEAALAFIDDHRSGRRQHEPCVILLDLHLPRYNGIEVLTALRMDPVLMHVHVFVLTSDASPSERAQVSELGGVCHIKPSDLEQMKALAMEILAACKDPREKMAEPALS
jgi:CheY-like chemotaxis protein